MYKNNYCSLATIFLFQKNEVIEYSADGSRSFIIYVAIQLKFSKPFWLLSFENFLQPFHLIHLKFSFSLSCVHNFSEAVQSFTLYILNDLSICLSSIHMPCIQVDTVRNIFVWEVTNILPLFVLNVQVVSVISALALHYASQVMSLFLNCWDASTQKACLQSKDFYRLHFFCHIPLHLFVMKNYCFIVRESSLSSNIEHCKGTLFVFNYLLFNLNG